MKKFISKRLLSAFLVLMMMVSMIPLSAITTYAAYFTTICVEYKGDDYEIDVEYTSQTKIRDVKVLVEKATGVPVEYQDLTPNRYYSVLYDNEMATPILDRYTDWTLESLETVPNDGKKHYYANGMFEVNDENGNLLNVGGSNYASGLGRLKIEFKQTADNENLYRLDTYRTMDEYTRYSEYPWYSLCIYDGRYYYVSPNYDQGTSTALENYTKSNPLSLKKKSSHTSITSAKATQFTSSTGEGKVVLWLDTSESTYKLYYTLEKDPVSEVVAYDSSILGDVETNVYVKLVDSDIDASTKLTVNYPDTGLTETAEYSLDELDTFDVNGVECYKVPTHIAAKEMQREINVKVTTGGEDVIDYTYCYADYLKAIVDGDYTDAQKELAAKVANYGGKAEKYFNYLESDKTYLDSSFPTTVPTKSAVSSAVAGDGYALSGIGNAGEKYYGSSLSLESDLVLKHYFQLPDGYEGTPTATGSNIVYQGKNGNLYEVDVKVSVKTINQTSEINVNGAELTYSPFTYIGKVLASGSTSDNLKNVCVALYDLYATAVK